MRWTPPRFCGINVPTGFHMVWRTVLNYVKESDMNATARFANLQSSTGAVVGVDIAEAVFQLCEADMKWQRKGKGKGSRGFACWFGITPRENSSGQKRRLGSISKQGDTYLRTLLVHGARSVLTAAAAAQAQGKPLDSLKRWALQLQARVGHNKAACALANKMARICYARLRDGQPYQAKMA